MNEDRPVQIQAMPPDSPEEELEKLSQNFLGRLRREQTLLASLTEALASANADSTLVLADIEMFAHRLRGAALVFGFAGIGEAAKAVELAAAAAAPGENGQRNDSSVVSTMRALAMNLAAETGSAV
jgi:Hpt domain